MQAGIAGREITSSLPLAGAMINAPEGLVSLLDLMIRYNLEDLSLFLRSAHAVCRDLKIADDLNHQIVDEKFLKNLGWIVDGLHITCSPFEADPTLLAQMKAFKDHLHSGNADKRECVLLAFLMPIMEGIQNSFASRMFLYVPADRSPHYMSLDAFGEAVDMFPDAITDMLEAGNCYAVGRATACVFHSMRVAEHGLRYVAEKMEIELTENGKPLPIEFATWEKVLIAIENKRKLQRQEPKDAASNEKTSYYAELASHCSHLKDMWRNQVMHSRGQYNLSEANGALSRVLEFLTAIVHGETERPFPSPLSNKNRDILKMARTAKPWRLLE